MRDAVKLFSIAIKENGWRIAAAVVLVLAARALSLVPPAIIGYIIDFITEKDFDTVYRFIWLLIVAAGVSAVAKPIQAWYLTRMVQDTIRSLSIAWSKEILRKDFAFFQTLNIGSLIKSAERGILAHESLLTFILLNVGPTVIELLLIVAYLVYVGGFWLLPILAVSTVILISATLTGIRWRRPFIDRVNETEDINADHFAELFEAGKTIKITGAIGTATVGLNATYFDYAKHATALSFASTALSSMQSFVTVASGALILLCGVLLIQTIQQPLSVGKFVILFTFSSMFINAIVEMTNAFRQFDEFAADKAEFDRVLSLPRYRNDLTSGGFENYDLEVRPFSLGGLDGARLENSSSIFIPFGSHVAITGPSGQGKTTLAELLAGITTERGMVYLGGKDIIEASEQELTGALFMGEHRARFLSGDLAQAVMFGLVVPEPEDVREKLSELHLQNLSYLVENAEFPASSLSAGEAKRFGLYRAMALSRPITILDEPTEALDRGIAQAIWAAIFHQFSGKTLICITHDTDILAQFDQVITVDQHQVSVVRASDVLAPKAADRLTPPSLR